MAIINFIKLIRPLNLLIIILLHALLRYYLIDQFIVNSALSNLDFFLFLYSTVAITAAGYIINDIYDEKIDEINKENSRIINKKIKSSSAIACYIILNASAFISIFYVAWTIKKPIYIYIFSIPLFMLLQSTKTIKSKISKRKY